ncbi:MAG: hypothetical protein M3O34_12740, partial [Chloroflexota bacterium]|nr:hypothetical protein [Chloroflexota bacterium]
ACPTPMLTWIIAEALNFFLAFLFWMMLGRIALAIISGGKRTFFTGLFEKATAPAWVVVRWITPRSVPDVHIAFLSLPLLLALRILLAPLLQGSG